MNLDTVKTALFVLQISISFSNEFLWLYYDIFVYIVILGLTGR